MQCHLGLWATFESLRIGLSKCEKRWHTVFPVAFINRQKEEETDCAQPTVQHKVQM